MRSITGYIRLLALGILCLFGRQAFAHEPILVSVFPVQKPWSSVDSIEGAFAYAVHPYLEAEAKNWYRESTFLLSTQIDPIYGILARLMGGYVVLGGGSDLIETLLGVAKMASPGEVNLVYPKPWRRHRGLLARAQRDLLLRFPLSEPAEVIMASQRHLNISMKFNLPGYAERIHAKKTQVLLNAESSEDLELMVHNAKQNRFLIDGNPYLAVPMKHGYIVVIDQGNKARLYFRTSGDRARWNNKILSLPQEDQIPARWYEAVERKKLIGILFYNLNVVARGKKAGWRLSQTSFQWIKELIEHLKFTPEETRYYFTRLGWLVTPPEYKLYLIPELDHRNNFFSNGTKLKVSDHDLQSVLNDFGLGSNCAFALGEMGSHPSKINVWRYNGAR